MEYVHASAESGAFDEARALLPAALRERLSGCSKAETEEIRLRVGRRLSVVSRGAERELEGEAVSSAEIMQTLEKATGASMHSASDSIARGYICCRGLRIGLCGEAALSGGQVVGYRNYSSIALRIPHQCRGACDAVARRVFEKGPESVLVISPPGLGKTTALRELVRIMADRGVRTAVSDERNELSASANGRPGCDLGRCSDVLVNIPKAEGAMMLLRGMNPQLIAMDEISDAADIEAIKTVTGCGVAILASAHAKNREDMLRRPLYRELMERGVFEWLVTISLRDGRRCYETESAEL